MINGNADKFIEGLHYDDGLHWIAHSDNNYSFPVKAFEEAKIFDGKSFWDVENEIEWVDC